MADIVIAWNEPTGQGDWTVANGSIATGASGSQDLETAVLVSLFTDAVAPPDYVFPPNDTDPRGWWADTYNGFTIGSLLWTLDRAKSTDNSVLRQAKVYCTQALQWLLDDGVATTVNVTTQWLKAGAVGIGITITKPSGQTFGYAYAWNGF